MTLPMPAPQSEFRPRRWPRRERPGNKPRHFHVESPNEKDDSKEFVIFDMQVFGHRMNHKKLKSDKLRRLACTVHYKWVQTTARRWRRADQQTVATPTSAVMPLMHNF